MKIDPVPGEEQQVDEAMRRVGLDRQMFVSWLAIVVPLVVTAVLWVVNELKSGLSDNWSEVAQILGLFATVLMSMALVIAARSRVVEEFYGGLDRSYRTHGTLAKAGFALMLLHPWLLIPGLWGDTDAIVSLIVPIVAKDATLPKALGIFGYWLFVVLVGLTLNRVLTYQRWWSSHRFMGVAFALAGGHAMLAYSDVRYFGPLRAWMGYWIVIGLVAWVYKTFLYERLAARHAYTVVANTPMGADVYDLHLMPEQTRLNFAPGEFAFLSVRGRADIGDEHHPLSIASAPHSSRLRFAYKALGDWTKRLTTVKPGDRVVVYGPYGEFHAYNLHHHRRQVWIGGGIGITPFMSMLEYEAHNDDRKQIWLYYATNDAAGAVFDKELQQCAAAHTDDELHYAAVTGERITAARIQADVGDLSDVAVLMCGPTPMMRGLAAEFRALGVPERRIYFEDFNFV